MSVEIPLTQGRVAIVDGRDRDLTAFNWHAVEVGRGSGKFYARRRISPMQCVHLHQVIASRMGISGAPDHVNRDGLDCRRGNLRVATNQEQAANHGVSRNNKSGFKGVAWCRRERKWRAYIRVNYKRRSLGYYEDPAMAAKAYDEAAVEAFGEFAYLNFPCNSLSPVTPEGR